MTHSYFSIINIISKIFALIYGVIHGLVLCSVAWLSLISVCGGEGLGVLLLVCVPLVGTLSAYWIFTGKYTPLRVFTIVISLLISVAILFILVFVSPKLDELSHAQDMSSPPELPKVIRQAQEKSSTSMIMPKKLPVGIEELEMVNSQDIHEADDIQGQLVFAIGEDNLAEVTRLLNQRAEVNYSMDKTGITPLMLTESMAMAELLVSRGGYAKATDSDGGSVLHYAVTQKKASELIRYFISLGVDPNLRGWQNEPPIFVACMFYREASKENDYPGVESVFTALLEGGADLNAQQDGGHTLLMDVVMGGDYNMVQLLLELGADKTVRDASGKTARDWADELDNMEIQQLLE